MWVDIEGKQGWAVGDGGVILRFERNKWERDEVASRISGAEDLRALWMDEKGEHGWVVLVPVKKPVILAAPISSGKGHPIRGRQSELYISFYI